MSIVQQINNIVEQMPLTEQQFILEVIKKMSNNLSNNTKEPLDKLLLKQKKTVKSVIQALNNAEKLKDDELDEILNNRVNITRDLDL